MIEGLPARIVNHDAPAQVSQSGLTQLVRAPDKPPTVADLTPPKQAMTQLAREVPLATVRIDGCLADVLLPSADLEPTAAWRLYLERIATSDSFRGQETPLAALARLDAQPAVAQNDDRPVVGILISDPRRMLPGNHEPTTAVIREVEAMGCRPLLIPPRADLMLPERRNARWAGVVALTLPLHGLVGPGGADVHPRMYLSKNKPHPHTGKPMCHNPIYPRDRFEADVALAAMDSEVFCFGICRSHQLWNAVRGRTMVQDVQGEGYSFITQDQETMGLDRSKPFIATKGGVTFENRVRLLRSSRMAREIGCTNLLTDSLHHQAVGWGIRKPNTKLQTLRPQLKRLRIVGTVRDPVTGVRTIEASEGWNVLTTQFHPEPRPESTPERRLFEVMGRRAHIFKLVRDMRTAGEPLTSAGILARMDGSFTATDRAWVQHDLMPHIEA